MQAQANRTSWKSLRKRAELEPIENRQLPANPYKMGLPKVRDQAVNCVSQLRGIVEVSRTVARRVPAGCPEFTLEGPRARRGHVPAGSDHPIKRLLSYHLAGASVQHRVTRLSPRPAIDAELKQLFLDSMTIW